MYARRTNSPLPFSEHVADLLEKASYHCKPSPESSELIKLTRRALAPLGLDHIPAFETDNVEPTLQDFDILTLLDGHTASTLRIRIDGANQKTLQISELTVKRKFALEVPGLPYLALRAAWLAAEHFGCDTLLIHCRADQQAFYARVFGFEPLSVSAEGADMRIASMALDFAGAKQRVEARYPMFCSIEAERLSIFGKPQTKPKYEPSAQSAA